MIVHYSFLFVKLLVGFLIVIFHWNFSGKTQLSQMNAIDLIGNFILGGVIGGVLFNDDITFPNYILSLLLGIFLINLLNFFVKKTSFFRGFAVGNPITLISEGRFCMDAIKNKNNKIDIHNIATSLRVMGKGEFSSLDFLQIEPSGQLSLISKKEKQPKFGVLLYSNGCFSDIDLEQQKLTQEQLINTTKKLGIKDFDMVFFIQYYNDTLVIVLDDGTVMEGSVNQ